MAKVEDIASGGRKVVGLIRGLFGGGDEAAAAAKVLANLPEEDVVRIAQDVRIRPGEILARGRGKAGPGRGTLLSAEQTARRRAYETLAGGSPRARRTYAQQTGRVLPMSEGFRPSRFGDIRTQRLVQTGKIGPDVPGRIQRATEFAARRPVVAGLLGTGVLGTAALAGPGLLRGAPQAEMSDEELLAVLANVGGGASPEQIVAQQRQAQEERIRQLYGGLSPELQAELDQQQAAYQQALREVGSGLAASIGELYTGPISAAGAVEGAYAGGAEAARAAAAAPTGTDVSMVTPVAGPAAVAPASIAARGGEMAGLEGLMGTLSDQELARMVALGQLTGEQAASDLMRDYQAALLGTRIQDEREMRRALLDLEQMYAEPELMAAQARSLGLSTLTPETLLEVARQAAIEWEGMDDATRAAYSQRGITTAEEYITARINQIAESAGLGEQ